ncbi:MAG: NAD-dependent epimerase/dehydratase family protein [Zetaproteobacteria bacterium]|nr:MAG: NAD-dependent epimerase/dehydratase family protein [Zetaproteobacteria bacterium]
MTDDHHLPQDLTDTTRLLGETVEAFAGKRLLITGGRGFLGRHFEALFRHLNATVLKPNPCRLLLMDNLITAGAAGQRKPCDTKEGTITFLHHDVTHPFDDGEGVDYVIHAAGIASPYYYRAYPLETLEVATTGCRNMLDLATRYRARMIFFSSSEIYGDPDPRHVPIPESYRGNVSVAGPRACYDESKRLGETLCHIYHEKFGTHTNVIRPFNVFGPGMQELDYRALPNFASRIKGGLPLNIYGSGDQTRTFCYIVDALNGFLRVVARGVPGEAYNIGTPGPEVSMFELVDYIEQALGRKIPCHTIEYPDSYPADEPRRRCPEIRKARLQLGYEPAIDLVEGLRRFFSWTEAHYRGVQ